MKYVLLFLLAGCGTMHPNDNYYWDAARSNFNSQIDAYSSRRQQQTNDSINRLLAPSNMSKCTPIAGSLYCN